MKYATSKIQFLAIAAVALLSACQRQSDDALIKAYQTQMGQAVTRLAATINSSQTVRGVRGSRGIFGLEGYTGSPYGGTYMNSNVYGEANQCASYLKTIPRQKATYAIFVTTAFRCAMEVAQYRNSMGTSLYRNAGADTQQMMQYLWGWRTNGLGLGGFQQLSNSSGAQFPYNTLGMQGFGGTSFGGVIQVPFNK